MLGSDPDAYASKVPHAVISKTDQSPYRPNGMALDPSWIADAANPLHQIQSRAGRPALYPSLHL